MIDKMNWKRAILPLNSSIEDAIRTLNDSALKIVLVLDQDERLLGTISDGDIRRGLLKGLRISSPISTIINLHPTVVSRDLTIEDIKKLMISKKVFQIPIVDMNNKLVGMHLWDGLGAPKKRPNTMVIMAGGKGERLLPKTERTPKPMLQVGGMPILEHIIRRAMSQGLENFYLAIRHLGHVIEDYFGNGDSLGVKIQYLRERSPLGTAGALSLLKPFPKEATIVTNGDVLTEVNYGNLIDFHSQNQSDATMAVQLREWQNPFGVVQTNGILITSYQEKPVISSLINAGVYVLDPKIVSLLNNSEAMDMPSLFELARQREHRVSAYLLHEPWIDVGSHEDFEYISRSFNEKTTNLSAQT